MIGQCSLRQLLEYGYFHADPHPENLLATPDRRLSFLDFGMMSETPEDARSSIISHVVHLVNRDYEAMARDYYALDFFSSNVDVSPIVPALIDFFDEAHNYIVSELNFKTLVDGLGNVLYQFPFNVPAYYALILRSLAVLEGLSLNADPNFKVLAASYPYFAKRLLTYPNPYLRDALIELIFKDEKFSASGVLLSPDGEVIRTLVIKEVVRVSEAFTLSLISDTYKSVPDFMRTLVFNGNANGPLMLSESKMPKHEYIEYFGPDYALHVAPSNMENESIRLLLDSIRSKLLKNLSKLQHAPSVKLQETPQVPEN
ncbi:Protein ACTIVITY OF BC1 COMPLEX KINASE 3 [Lathyrus oleraceus]|uniref:Protein ACTIVITY OF BC1 COMPLEX KINASE 3 n=1 Tax=Pisum sativum TaxID=3888 RepID=A0A9D4XBV0_PEA|nr:Protein ACTIVITY OF BC1 COMPLEX KINASE 3 [Pisum sativum]